MKTNMYKSSLNNDKIKKNFENIDYFQGVISSLNEVLAYEKRKTKIITNSTL